MTFIDDNPLPKLCSDWLSAKQDEKEANDRRRDIESKIASLLGTPENLEGTETHNLDCGYKVKVIGRMNHKIDGDALQEIAAENGLTEQLSRLFRWKPDLNMAAWKSADKNITTPLLGAITTTPGKPSFSIEKKDEE
jgi:hypothetical protein